jgi:hypothetical protein
MLLQTLGIKELRTSRPKSCEPHNIKSCKRIFIPSQPYFIGITFAISDCMLISFIFAIVPSCSYRTKSTMFGSTKTVMLLLLVALIGICSADTYWDCKCIFSGGRTNYVGTINQEEFDHLSGVCSDGFDYRLVPVAGCCINDSFNESACSPDSDLGLCGTYCS